jgi:type II secretory pathway component PulC
VITKSELAAVLKDGPQAFVQKVRVRPAFRSGRFLGWRVLDYEGPGPVRVGDIVMRVNGHGLERPEHFMRAWASLDGRGDLVVELVRGGRAATLRFPIVD